MKNTMIAAALAFALGTGALVSGASAQFAGPGAGSGIGTVADVKRVGHDDQRVVLKGHILRHIGGDKYIFSDGTGEIRVDIDHEEWPAAKIDDKTLVEIVGKLDTDWSSRPSEIDVKVLRIVR